MGLPEWSRLIKRRTKEQTATHASAFSHRALWPVPCPFDDSTSTFLSLSRAILNVFMYSTQFPGNGLSGFHTASRAAQVSISSLPPGHNLSKSVCTHVGAMKTLVPFQKDSRPPSAVANQNEKGDPPFPPMYLLRPNRTEVQL